jgi:lipoprotein-releasing system permease protein
MNFNWFIAKRIGNKADATGRLSKMGTVISVVSVAVSVAVIVAVTAVADGFRNEIAGKVRSFSGDVVLAAPGSDILNVAKPVDAPLSYLQKLQELPFVERVSGVAYRQGVIKGEEEISGLMLKGVDSLYNLESYSGSLLQGALPKLNGKAPSNEVVISRSLADALKLNAGDKITAYFPDEQLKVRRFTISGVFDTGLEQFDKYLAIGDIRQVVRLNGWGDNQLSGYEIFLNNEAAGVTLEQEDAIAQVIYENSLTEDSQVAATVLQEKYYTLFDWLNLLDLNVVIVLSLMIAVAGFNMVSSLLIMLFERISQIGLLKALGMTNRAVAKVFIAKAAMVVLQGMLWGNVLGVGFCLLQGKYHILTLNPQDYFVPWVPISLEASTVIITNLVAFAAIMAIMLLPCLFISKVDPATTMRVK